MNDFIKHHPIISCIVGFLVVAGLSLLLGWAIGGPVMAGRFAGWVSGGYIFGLAMVIIEHIAAKTYEKKTGKNIQELMEQEEKNQKIDKKTHENDDCDDGL